MATKYQGTEKEVRALNALINMMRASDALTSSLQRELAGTRLTPSQFGTMEALLHLGPLRQGELAKKLLRCCGSITAVVEGLERRGLVEREREADDSRFVRVTLTDKGRKLIQKIFPTHVQTVSKRFSALTNHEQEEMRRLCRKLGKSITEA